MLHSTVVRSVLDFFSNYSYCYNNYFYIEYKVVNYPALSAN